MSTWIPEDKRDTRWWIWKKTFLCKISTIQSMSIDYLQYFGMPKSGNPDYDRGMSDELVQRMLPISEMIRLFDSGVTVQVCNYSDTKLIYEYITNHLNWWKQHLSTGVHTRNAPIDDLLVMDRFAMVVYKHAVHQFTEEFVDSIFARSMTRGRVTRDSILSAGPKELVLNGDGELEEPALPERESMAEAFAKRRAKSVSPTGKAGSRW